MPKKLLLTSLFIFTSFLLTASAHAATYYVAQNGGSDSNSCSSAQSASGAKVTIRAGLGCLSAGETLIIGSGVYNEYFSRGDEIPSGNPGSPTTIKSEVQYGAVIRRSDTHRQNMPFGSRVPTIL